MSTPDNVSGTAALAICESLLLAMNDRKVLPEGEIIGVLRDAASAHEAALRHSDNPAHHVAVIKLIHSIIDGGNSVRRRM